MIPKTQAILGSPQVPPGKLRQYLIGQRYDFDRIESVVCAYTCYGELTGIGNLIPFAQAVKETGGFKSERWVQSYNPAGLGATNDGAWGGTFSTAAEGIVAQYAHLIAYCIGVTTTKVNQVLLNLDPRIKPMIEKGLLGKAPRWIDLDGKWAVPGNGYGESILQIASVIGGI